MENESSGMLAEAVDANSGIDARSLWRGDAMRYKTYDSRICVYSLPMLASMLGGAYAEATKPEQAAFLTYCIANRLDPIRKQVYFVRYKANQPASFVVSWEVFLERAQRHPQFDGFKNGIIWRVKSNDSWLNKKGRPSDFTEDDNHEIAGGWAIVYRKDRKVPVSIDVPMGEMEGVYWDKDARQHVRNKSWSRMPTTMAIKTPTARALRQSFPEDLAGLYTENEAEHFIESTAEEVTGDGELVPIESMDDLANLADPTDVLDHSSTEAEA